MVAVGVTLMRNHETGQNHIRQMRALVRDARERITPLRPAWSVHLADETLCRLHEVLDALEADIVHSAAEDSPSDVAGDSTHRSSESIR